MRTGRGEPGQGDGVHALALLRPLGWRPDQPCSGTAPVRTVAACTTIQGWAGEALDLSGIHLGSRRDAHGQGLHHDSQHDRNAARLGRQAEARNTTYVQIGWKQGSSCKGCKPVRAHPTSRYTKAGYNWAGLWRLEASPPLGEVAWAAALRARRRS